MPDAFPLKPILTVIAFAIALASQTGAVIGAPPPPVASQPPSPGAAPAGGNQQQLPPKAQGQPQQQTGNPPVPPGTQPAGPGAGAQNGSAQQPASGNNGTSGEGWALVSAFAALGSAAAAGFLAIYGKQQLSLLNDTVAVARGTLVETRKAANAAKISADALKNTERANLLVHGSGRGSDGEVDEGTGMAQGQMRCMLRNHGRTVGIVQSIVGTARYLPDGERPSMIGLPDLSLQDTFIPAGGEISTDFFTYPSKPEWSERARATDRANDMRLLIWGEVVYADIFGEIHTTRFCLRFHPAWGRFVPNDSEKIDKA